MTQGESDLKILESIQSLRTVGDVTEGKYATQQKRF